jgi:hypothetical protein
VRPANNSHTQKEAAVEGDPVSELDRAVVKLFLSVLHNTELWFDGRDNFATFPQKP